jgi:hypothetical protein
MSSLVTDNNNSRKIKKLPSKLLPPKSGKPKGLTRGLSQMNLKKASSPPNLKIKIPGKQKSSPTPILQNKLGFGPIDINKDNSFRPIGSTHSSSKDTISPSSSQNTPKDKSPGADRLRERASRSKSPLYTYINSRNTPRSPGFLSVGKKQKEKELENSGFSFLDSGFYNFKPQEDFEKKFYPKNLLDITKIKKKGGRKSRKRIRHKYKKRSRKLKKKKSRKLKKKKSRKLKKKRSKKIKLKKRKTKKRKLKKRKTRKLKKLKLKKKKTRKRSKYGGTKVFEMVPLLEKQKKV